MFKEDEEGRQDTTAVYDGNALDIGSRLKIEELAVL